MEAQKTGVLPLTLMECKEDLRTVKIRVCDLVGGSSCLDPQLGNRVCAAVIAQIKRGEGVELLFERTTHVTIAFLNIAIGKLYDPSAVDPHDVDMLLSYPDADAYLQDKIHIVVMAAKRFYNCKEKFLGFFESR